MSLYIAPSFEARKFNCPRCGALSQQDWKALVSMSSLNGWAGGPVALDIADMGDAQIVPDLDGDLQRIGRSWSAAQCGGCEDHSLWIDGVIVFPSATDGTKADMPRPADDMPDDIRVLYLEAVAVYPHSRRAAAALCRAALERLAKLLTPDLPTRVTLDGRLAALSRDTDVSTYKVLSIIRHVGNTALHGEAEGDESAVIYLGNDPTHDMPDLFFTAMNELVAERITRPKRVDDLYATLPDGVRQDIEMKMKRARREIQTEDDSYRTD